MAGCLEVVVALVACGVRLGVPVSVPSKFSFSVFGLVAFKSSLK